MKKLLVSNSKYRGHIGSGNWTLCIGAGISRGIVPTWNELTRRVINKVFSSSYTLKEFDDIVSDNGWGLDGWIQAAANEHKHNGGSTEDFYILLEDFLYDDLRKKAASEGIETEVVTALNDPRNISKKAVFTTCEFFEKNYKNTSLLALAKSLIASLDAPDKMPASIITFNADTLLHTIIELFQRRTHYQTPPPHSHPKYYFKTILRSTGGVPKDKIPIFHCHGAIKPKSAKKGSNQYDSRDKLVFLEQEYLQVATSSSAWPETIFMFSAQTSRMVFVGLSMADPNIRRWMATANQIYLSDIEVVAKTNDVTPSNIWITPTTGDSTLDNIKQVALSHLGVRPGWINSWSDLEVSLNNLLGIEK